MKSINWRKGSVLLQTLVICLLLAYVSISVTKWVLQRYSGVANTYRGNMAMGTAGGGADRVVSEWNFNTPPGSGNYSIDAKNLTYKTWVVTSGVYKVEFKYETEQAQ